jgi:hypothetical protein
MIVSLVSIFPSIWPLVTRCAFVATSPSPPFSALFGLSFTPYLGLSHFSMDVPRLSYRHPWHSRLTIPSGFAICFIDRLVLTSIISLSFSNHLLNYGHSIRTPCTNAFEDFHVLIETLQVISMSVISRRGKQDIISFYVAAKSGSSATFLFWSHQKNKLKIDSHKILKILKPPKRWKYSCPDPIWTNLDGCFFHFRAFQNIQNAICECLRGRNSESQKGVDLDGISSLSKRVGLEYSWTSNDRYFHPSHCISEILDAGFPIAISDLMFAIVIPLGVRQQIFIKVWNCISHQSMWKNFMMSRRNPNQNDISLSSAFWFTSSSAFHSQPFSVSRLIINLRPSHKWFNTSIFLVFQWLTGWNSDHYQFIDYDLVWRKSSTDTINLLHQPYPMKLEMILRLLASNSQICWVEFRIVELHFPTPSFWDRG